MYSHWLHVCPLIVDKDLNEVLFGEFNTFWVCDSVCFECLSSSICSVDSVAFFVVDEVCSFVHIFGGYFESMWPGICLSVSCVEHVIATNSFTAFQFKHLGKNRIGAVWSGHSVWVSPTHCFSLASVHLGCGSCVQRPLAWNVTPNGNVLMNLQSWI